MTKLSSLGLPTVPYTAMAIYLQWAYGFGPYHNLAVWVFCRTPPVRYGNYNGHYMVPYGIWHNVTYIFVRQLATSSIQCTYSPRMLRIAFRCTFWSLDTQQVNRRSVGWNQAPHYILNQHEVWCRTTDIMPCLRVSCVAQLSWMRDFKPSFLCIIAWSSLQKFVTLVRTSESSSLTGFGRLSRGDSLSLPSTSFQLQQLDACDKRI